jgi:hypothetical protein
MRAGAEGCPVVEPEPCAGSVRPTIDLGRKWIAPNFGRGARAISATPPELRSLWDNVVAQVTAAGLALGIRLEAPPELPGAAEGK